MLSMSGRLEEDAHKSALLQSHCEACKRTCVPEGALGRVGSPRWVPKVGKGGSGNISWYHMTTATYWFKDLQSMVTVQIAPLY